MINNLHQLAGQASVGRVSAKRVTRQGSGTVAPGDVLLLEDVGLRCANPTYALGFCGDPDMLLAFKRLCRYYYGIDPVAAAWHVNAYREMWDAPDEVVPGGGV